MGFRFRKSFPLGSLLRLNFSKTGVSLGVGPRGFNMTIGPKGIRRTVGIPGTGLSYQDSQSWGQIGEADRVAIPAEAASKGFPWGLVMVVAVAAAFLLGYLLASPGNNSTGPAPAPPVQYTAPVAAPEALAADRPLTKSEVRELQRLLARGGFKPGPADGLFGPSTAIAVKNFKMRNEAAFVMENPNADGVGVDAKRLDEPTVATLEKARLLIGFEAGR